MEGRIGTCSICGGDVIGHIGPWHGVVPPTPGRCSQCGAAEERGPVIPMRPATPNDKQHAPGWLHTITDNTKGE